MFVEIVFPISLSKRFTYSLPENLIEKTEIGMRAVAPFGKKTLTGFIVKKKDKLEENISVKPIRFLLDRKQIFNETELNFYEWLSTYYMCSLGEALKLSVPQGTDISSKKKLIIDTDYIKKILNTSKKISETKRKVFEILSEHQSISVSRLKSLTSKKSIYSILNTLQEEGAITIHEEESKPKVREKKIRYVKLAVTADNALDLIAGYEEKHPKYVSILLTLLKYKKDGLPVPRLMKDAGVSISPIDSLVKKGILTFYLKHIERKYSEHFIEEKRVFELTAEQKNVIDSVLSAAKKNELTPFLLHGITGSGKTQVYIELTKEILSQGKSVLILVPEISLTPQMNARMINNFGNLVTVQHSRMSLGERYDAWVKILNGECRVVVGARSALFAPINNLGLIVVDEEHDSSYKQDDLTPKYHARDSAIMKAHFHKCPILLASATPSVESMYNAITKKYKLLELKERVDGAKLPFITIVDLTEAKKSKKIEGVFSHLLIDEIKRRLIAKEGVILLQNRRGFATQLYCLDCGEVEMCDNCSVSYVYHIGTNQLVCHYCGITKSAPSNCIFCGSDKLKFFGTGTERVEDELAAHFPGAVIERIDSDSISQKGSLGKILSRFSEGEIDILVGTQMVSKGLDFPRVTLVGVISAETSLWLPDFRADERTFQLLTQVAGRSGRSNAPGEVIIQTNNAKHFVIQKVVTSDYDGFFQKEILDREKKEYPPFTRIALIETKDKSDQKAKGAINDIYKELYVFSNHIILSRPATAVIHKLRGEYRYQLLLKTKRVEDPGGAKLRSAIKTSLERFTKTSSFSSVRHIVEIDPQSII